MRAIFRPAQGPRSGTARRDGLSRSPPDRRRGRRHPLTSKIAVIGRATRADADVDYLFLQVVVDKAEVSGSQNCGTFSPASARRAIENGLVAVAGPTTPVRIHMVNTGSIAVANVPTPNGAGVRGRYPHRRRSGYRRRNQHRLSRRRGFLLRSAVSDEYITDSIDGVEVTCIDNGMPVVPLAAEDFGLNGAESPEALEANAALKARVEKIRLARGPA